MMKYSESPGKRTVDRLRMEKRVNKQPEISLLCGKNKRGKNLGSFEKRFHHIFKSVVDLIFFSIVRFGWLHKTIFFFNCRRNK